VHCLFDMIHKIDADYITSNINRLSLFILEINQLDAQNLF